MNLKQLKNIEKIAEERHKEIIDKIVETYKDIVKYPAYSGHMDVLIDEDGNIFNTGLMGNQTFTRGEFYGSYYVIGRIEAQNFDEDDNDFIEYANNMYENFRSELDFHVNGQM